MTDMHNIGSNDASDPKMTIESSMQKMKARLSELSKIDVGYPLGENVVREASRSSGLPTAFLSMNGSKWLCTLYSVCDGLSFPDVHVGYFVKPLERVMSCDRQSEPDTVILDREISVLPFGSTGGGSLFVVGCERGDVMLLPPALLSGGRYHGKEGVVIEVAATVPLFFERLLADLTAFVNDEQHHNYIAK